MNNMTWYSVILKEEKQGVSSSHVEQIAQASYHCLTEFDKCCTF